MKIGIDFDSTIAQTDLARVKWVYENLGITVDRSRTGRTYSVPIIGDENHERMIRETCEEITLSIPMVEGFESVLPLIASQGEIYLITDRKDYDPNSKGLNQMDYARQVLRSHGMERFFSGFLSSKGKNKQQICFDNGIEWLIDDDPRHLQDQGLGINRVNMRIAGDLTNPQGVHLAHNWHDVARILEHYRGIEIALR